MSLVDLAGSERFLDKSVDKERDLEAQSINKSLSSLKEVINVICKN